MATEITPDMSDVKAIQRFFFPGDLKAATKEIRELTPADRVELGNAIRATVAN